MLSETSEDGDERTYDYVRVCVASNVLVVLCHVRVLFVAVFAVEGTENVLDFGLSLFFNRDQFLQTA